MAMKNEFLVHRGGRGRGPPSENVLFINEIKPDTGILTNLPDIALHNVKLKL